MTTNHLFKKEKIGKNCASDVAMQEEKETGWQDLLQKEGLTFKAGDTVLEGQAYEFMTGHDTIVSMGDELKECLP